MLNRACPEDHRLLDFTQPSSYHFARQPPLATPLHGRSKSAPLDDSALPILDVSTPCYQDWIYIEGNRKRQLLDRRRLALEQDVICLQARLQEERDIRFSLEKALVNASTSISPGRRQIAPETRELIAETALLEYEVAHLEQVVLSLYRKLHLQQLRPSVSTASNVQKLRGVKSVWLKSRSHLPPTGSPSCQTRNLNHKLLSFEQSPKVSKDSRSSPLHHLLEAMHSREKKLCEMPALDSPGYRISTPDSFLGNANQLSEQLLRCMAGIYCTLAEPPIFQRGLSPASPGRMSKTNNGCISNPFELKEQLGDAGAYRFMLEVPWISVGKEQLAFAAHALQEFKSMVRSLSSIDVSVMKRDEKLAFWINIYNALVMHAYLAYGIPSNRLKRASLLQKAAYQVGSHSINAYRIEQDILGCRTRASGQWLQALLSPLSRLKANEEKRSYRLTSYEPLVCFALCSGARSDPSVRVYTARSVEEQLELAKSEFLQASVGIGSNDRIALPKMLETYAKDAGMNSNNLLEWVCSSLPDRHCSSVRECIGYQQKKKGRKFQWLEWLPFDSSFRYILARDLLPFSLN